MALPLEVKECTRMSKYLASFRIPVQNGCHNISFSDKFVIGRQGSFFASWEQAVLLLLVWFVRRCYWHFLDLLILANNEEVSSMSEDHEGEEEVLWEMPNAHQWFWQSGYGTSSEINRNKGNT